MHELIYKIINYTYYLHSFEKNKNIIIFFRNIFYKLEDTFDPI